MAESCLTSKYCSYLLTFLFLGSAPLAWAEDARSEKLIDAVVAGIEHNDSQITTIKATMLSTTERAWVKERREVTVELPGGARGSFIESPKSEEYHRIIIRGDQLRSELFDPDQAQAIEVIVRNKEGDWAQYSPTNNAAWIRPEGGMPGVSPYDPRQMGFWEVGDRFPDLLRKERLLSVVALKGASKSALIEVVLRDSKQRKMSVRFDGSVNFLPIVINYYQAADSDYLAGSTSIEYQRLNGCDAWFPEKGVMKIFEKGVAKTPDAGTYREKTTIEVRDLIVNADLPDEDFSLKLPPGTRVNDARTRKSPAVHPEVSRSSSKWLRILFSVVSLLCIFLFLVRRKIVKAKVE